MVKFDVKPMLMVYNSHICMCMCMHNVQLHIVLAIGKNLCNALYINDLINKNSKVIHRL